MNALHRMLLPALLAAAATIAPLERGAELPALRGERLDGVQTELPAAARGRVTLVALGFTRGSSKAVEAYGGRFKAAFGSDSSYDWFEVPVIGGLTRVAKPLITSGMRGGTPEADRRHVMTVWADAGDWKRRVGYREGEWAYLVLLDREGRVRWRGQGAFDDGTWAELLAAAKAAR